MLRQNLRRQIVLTIGAVFILSLSASTPAAEPAKTVDGLIQTIPLTGDAPVWVVGGTLAELGEAARGDLEAALVNANPPTTVAVSYALMKIGEGIQHPATKALDVLIRDTNAPLNRRREAAQTLGAHGGDYANRLIREILVDQALRKTLNERLRVDLALSLWKLTNGGTAFEELHAIVTKGKSVKARTEATLALGRAGRISDVLGALQKLAGQPGGDGDEARTLLQLHRKITLETSSDKFPVRLVSEVITRIRQYYAPDAQDKDEAEQLKPNNLADQAASAVLRSIDPFSDYLTEESYRELADQMQGGYGGIGAYVGMRADRRGDEHFTILNPMYGHPAYKAHLRAGDVIEAIDGKNIQGWKMKNIIKLLKGDPKTSVTVTVKRRGRKGTKDHTVIRDAISMPSITTQMLPGNIGYVQLSGFNSKTGTKLAEALTAFKKENANGVVLDLVNNPGGLLSAAVAVTELFIAKGKRVVSSKGKPNVYPEKVYYSKRPPLYDGPLVVMVNGGSASASEIVSGALRDHGRAPLVGQKTYGKGSVQQLIPVNVTRGASRIKLTIAKYYLPKGECIHGRGIKPDVKVEPEDAEQDEWKARFAIREGRKIFDWVEKTRKAEKIDLIKLLEFDELKTSKYPGFSELYALLNRVYGKKFARKGGDGKLDPEWVRRELRSSIREYLKFREGINIPADLEENTILQHALHELGKQIEGGLPKRPVYEWFQAKFKTEEAEKIVADKLAAKEENAAEKNVTK